MHSKPLRLVAAISAVAFLVTSGAGSAATSHKHAAKPYHIAIVGSMTGLVGYIGTSWAAGAQTVFKYVNSRGGVNGHKITWTIYDDQSSVTVSPGAAQQALGSNPVAIMDGTASGFFNSRYPVYQSAQVPVFSDSAIAQGLQPWLYSDFPTVPQSAAAFVGMVTGYYHGVIRGKKVAMIAADTAGSRAQVPLVKALLSRKNASLVDAEYQPIGAPSFTSGAANILAAGADAVVISDTTTDGIVEAKALLDSGFKGPILSNYGAAAPEVFQAVASPQFYGQYLAPPVTKGTLAYTLAKRYGYLSLSTNVRYQLGWSGAYTLVNGLTKCTYPCSAKALETAIDGLGHYKVPGGVQFGPYFASPSNHNILKFYRLYYWDAKTKQAVPLKLSKLFNLGNPGYSNGG